MGTAASFLHRAIEYELGCTVAHDKIATQATNFSLAKAVVRRLGPRRACLANGPVANLGVDFAPGRAVLCGKGTKRHARWTATWVRSRRSRGVGEGISGDI